MNEKTVVRESITEETLNITAFILDTAKQYAILVAECKRLHAENAALKKAVEQQAPVTEVKE
jgi:hypothetical protein